MIPFEIEPAHTARLFFCSVLLGVLFGVYYELFRFLRKLFPAPTVLVFFQDLLFWLPAAPVLFLFTYALSEGMFRWFSAAGILTGFLLYLKTLGRILFRLYSAAIASIRRALKRAFLALFRPVRNFFEKNVKRLLKPLKKFVILKTEKAKLKRAERKAARRKGENADEGTSGILCETRRRGDPRFSRDLHRE